jgi:Ca2+-binding EF-hand superfamily protein
MSKQIVRQRRSFFRRSDPFIERNSTLLSIIGSSNELTERVLRERIEKFDVGKWSKDLEDIFRTLGSNFDVQSSNFDVQSSNFDIQFDEFVILSSMACVGIDKGDHLRKCLKFFPKSEDLRNHDLVS